MIGCRSGKIVRRGVRQTKCKKCQAINKNGIPNPHDCMINWEGGSGAMEAAVALDLCQDICDSSNGRVFIETIVSDNNSTMRSHIQHATNGGKLKDYIPEPDFKTDPSH